MIAIAEIDVGMARAEKHRAVARCGPAKVVGSGIARRVGLSFDDAAAEVRTGEFADDNFTDEKAS